MKRLLFSIFVALPVALRASSPVGLLPEDKAPVAVAAKERNPFGKIGPRSVTTVAETEESRIRHIVEHLPVGGVMEGRTGRKVLLGSLFIEEGRVLPPVIPRQTEKLRVASVAKDKVEIVFLESDGAPGMRKIVVSLSMTPDVQFRVAKPTVKAPEDGGFDFDGVLKKDDIGTTR